MEIKDALAEIVRNKGEIFIKARDKGHADSMRVTAFNIRRRMPEQLTGSIGIQTVHEDRFFFLRVFDRGIDGAEIFIRDKESGKLIPAPVSEHDPEIMRMVTLMRKDGKSEEEINEVLKGGGKDVS